MAHRERIATHHHDQHQLLTPTRGVLTVETPDATWIVPPHRAVWIPAGVPHGHRAHGATELRGLTFDLADNPLGAERPAVLAAGPLVREAVIVLTGEPDLEPEQRRTLERVVLDRLRRARALDVRLPTPSDPRLRDIAGLLSRDPADGRTLAALGRAVGASERTLSRLFREQTGMTFPQWRTQVRLHHALLRLAAGASVTATAAACGYATPSAFIQSFRAVFGTTPGATTGASTGTTTGAADPP